MNNSTMTMAQNTTQLTILRPGSYVYPNNYSRNYSENKKSSFSAGRPGPNPILLANMLHDLFEKINDNESDRQSMATASLHSNSFQSFPILGLISLWFVLIVNPIVILLGVAGNLMAIYILITCNITKLPVSFYTVMLNISDTFNLLIPVFIFWLDNCVNRSFERGYFRDKSNFLCKALMCPDQLFAALSAWYMCAISFNRWYSVCRPSSYFFRNTAATLSQKGARPNSNEKNGIQSRWSSRSSSSKTFIPFCFLSKNPRFRSHSRAFRSIAIITLFGILCCLYPIFMHELRPVNTKSGQSNELQRKANNKYPSTVKRCNYSRKHEYAYDIIGIILSCFLHILPLTFIAAMNLMIITRLKQRQRLMISSTKTLQSFKCLGKKKREFEIISMNVTQINRAGEMDYEMTKKDKTCRLSQTGLIPTTLITRKDQSTSTDPPLLIPEIIGKRVNGSMKTNQIKRHHSRDRTITIMLVSVALSYLILTLPYRLFWSYNVYTRRVHPDKLLSPSYLIKMHHIDHLLRTIRHIHYGTNFVFFILLSKTFRRRFRQLFVETFCQKTNKLFSRSSVSSESQRQRRSNPRLSKFERKILEDNRLIGVDSLSRSLFDEPPSLGNDRQKEAEDSSRSCGLEHHRFDSQSS